MAELPHISLFDGINDPELKTALAALPTRRYPKGMVIFDELDNSEEVFVVLSGSVEIVRQSKEGELARLALLKIGDLFGEFSYLTSAPRSSAAVALEEAQLLELSASWLSEIHRKYPEVRSRLLELYRSRVLHNVLRTTRLFSSLEPKALSQLASRMELRELANGSEILKEGTTGLDLVVIKKGKVEITKKQGENVVTLGELSAGDVLGEMAIITGEPRSASAHAKGPTEIMLLPGEHFRTALETYPSLLKAIEDVVRSRAEETRKAVESVLKEIVGESWSDIAESAGLLVESLNIRSSIVLGALQSDAKLIRVSRTQWTLQLPSAPGNMPNLGALVAVNLKPSRSKDLASLPTHSLSGKLAAVNGPQIVVTMGGDEASEKELVPVVTALARARVRLFIYPEYDVEKLKMEVSVRRGKNITFEAPLLAMSQTAAKISSRGDWPDGEMAHVTFRRGGKEFSTTKAVALTSDDQRREIQFEYETGAERSAIEQFLRELTRELGFGQSATPRAEAGVRSRFDHLLTKNFSNPEQFLKTYVGSMEGGVLRLEAKDKLPRGTAVRINISVAGKKGTHRLTFTGLVRTWENGSSDVELDEISPSLREKVEQLCKRLIEERSAASWEKRKKALVESGVKVTEPSERSPWGAVAAILFFSVVGGWWIIQVRQGPTPAPSDAMLEKNDRTPKDEVMQLQTSEGPMTVRVSEIKTIRLTDDPGAIKITVGDKTVGLSAEAAAHLTPFLKQQLEKLREISKQP